MVIALSKKVCLLGDFSVGKTSLMRQFVHHTFEDKYVSTVGVKVSRKSVAVTTDAGVIDLAMVVWDLAGSEEFDQMRASYLRGAAGGVLVCDLTRPETLASLRAYVADMRQISPDARFIVAANKQDLVGQQCLDEEQIREFANQLPAAYFLTSAKTGHAVEALFRCLGHSLAS